MALQFYFTTSPALLLSTIALGYFVLTRVWTSYKYKALWRPASTLPLLGNTLDLVRTHRNRVHEWFLEETMRSNGKPWLFTAIGRPPVILLTQQSHFEDVLKEQFETFEKGPIIREFVQDFFGENGIFGLDGAAWRHQRKTASHLFSHSMMREIMERAIIDDTHVLVQRLQEACDATITVDLKYLMDALTTDVFTRIGFGIRLGCLNNSAGTDDASGSLFNAEFHRAFSRCPRVIQSRAQQPTFVWKLKRWLRIGSEKQLADDMQRINSAMYQVIQESMDRHRQGEATEKTLISLFLSKANEGEETGEDSIDESTPAVIRDMALNFIAAGRGTTAQSLDWIILMINRYPSIHQQIIEELQRELPFLVSTTDAWRVPTMEEAARLVYLEAVVRESMRLNPAAPMNARTAMKDAVLSDGTFVPKGTRVMIPTYATARFPWLWGEDAAEFKPERWIDRETGKIINVSPFKFLVFHAGPRMCLGMKLAMLEMKMSLAAMLSKFEIRTTRDPFEVTYDMSLSLPVQGDLLATVAPIQKQSANAVDKATARVA